MRNIAIFSLFLFQLSSFGFDLPFMNPLVDMIHNSNEILSYSCSPDSMPSYDEMEGELLVKDFYPRDSHELFRGARIHDESKHLKDVFDELTMTDGNFYGSGCRNILCLAKKNYSSSLIRDMYFVSKFSLNLRVKRKNQINIENLELLEKALMLFPKHIWNITSKEVSKVQKSANPFMGNSKVLAMVDQTTKTLTLYPSFDNPYISSARKVAVLFHELSHLIDLRLGHLSEQTEWMSISMWEGTIGNKWEMKRKKEFVSKYAKQNPSEDFAESMVAYRFAPEELKERSPRKYGYLREVIFQGLEYRNIQDCNERADFKEFITEHSEKDYSFQCEHSTYGATEREKELKEACYKYYSDKDKSLKLDAYLSSNGFWGLEAYKSLREKLAKDYQFPFKVQSAEAL